LSVPSVLDRDRSPLNRDGAARVRAALRPEDLKRLRSLAESLPPDRAGIRLRGIEPLRALLAAPGSVGALAASMMGPACKPVRAILFDKTPRTNWALGWHQDRTIAVELRVDTPRFGPWTVKSGIPHVAPPIEILNGMLTLRVHLDEVVASNAPLLIARGSHRLGLIPEATIPDVVRRCGTMACHAEMGDIWVYSTPILHASDAATLPHHRRVLQVDYAIGDLPGGLRWCGV
jgi:hypothetical protein